MMACALGRERGDSIERCGGVSVTYFRFQRVPPAQSSSSTPRAARSSRMRSAAAKSRRRRAAWRSSISRSISSTGTGGCSSSAAAQAEDAEHLIELVERLADGRHVARPELAGVDRRVERAHQLEHRAERRRGVQIVLHRLGERLARLARRARQSRDAIRSRVTVSSRARKSVSRRSASSAWPRLAQVKLSCLR